MIIALGSDHAGFPLKETLRQYLQSQGRQVLDLGCFDDQSADYPAYGRAVARAVLGGKAQRGILVCGTGIGISIAANRIPGVRAALCTDTYMARMARRHNDANILAMGSRVVGCGLAQDIADIFLDTPYDGGRHQRRLDMLDHPADE